MSLLKHLNENCPVCGSRLVSLQLGMTHTNGHTPEHVRYDCGCCMSFIPNFFGDPAAIDSTVLCPKSPERKTVKVKVELELCLEVRDGMTEGHGGLTPVDFLVQNMNFRPELNENAYDSVHRKGLFFIGTPTIVGINRNGEKA